jgi:hypothetical protein
MKKIITVIFMIMSWYGYAQNMFIENKFTLGLGMQFADPQEGLKEIKYNRGIGPQISLLTPCYPELSWLNVQFGAQMDFANMGWKTYRDIELSADIVGDGRLRVKNNMYGLFAKTRINLGAYDASFKPYIDLMFGHRHFSTGSVLILNRPKRNPDYEKKDYTNRIVFTRMMHYGAGIGFCTLNEEHVIFEFGVSYTRGGPGTVLPLKDLSRSPGGDDIDFSKHQRVNTDMLGVHIGVRGFIDRSNFGG